MIIQRIIFPEQPDGQKVPSLYYRAQPTDLTIHGETAFTLKAHREIVFDTFFNALSLGAWHEYTDIEHFSLDVQGQGHFVLKVHYATLDDETQALTTQLVYEKEVCLPTKGTVSCPLTQPAGMLAEGFFYVSLVAMSDTHIDLCAFVTEDTPTHDVKLGLVITHFNRQPYVQSTVTRLSQRFLSEYGDRAKLVIVDNSKNLALTGDVDSAIEVLPNPNVGGSGGFMRGLLHLKDAGFTHCLFMDDDASCEVESIRRTYCLFAYAKAGVRQAVSGILMKEELPHLVLERGAIFSKGYVGVSAMTDNRVWREVMSSDALRSKANYGAWCFFAFKLEQVRHYAYPFFVRGDDILFSLQNDFKICTLNGIATWVDDFGVKDTLISKYLGLRAQLILNIYTQTMSKRRLLKAAKQSVHHFNGTYNYLSSQAHLAAFKDFLKGPQYLVDDLTGDRFRAQIAALGHAEKLKPIDLKAYRTQDLQAQFQDTLKGQFENSIAHLNPQKAKALGIGKKRDKTRFLRSITLNGLLVPTCFYSQQPAVEFKHANGNLQRTFLKREVHYVNPLTGQGYIASLNRTQAWKNYRDLLKVMWRLSCQFEALQKQYQMSFLELTTESFWRHALKAVQ